MNMNGESEMKPREMKKKKTEPIKENDQNQNQKKRMLPDEAEKQRTEHFRGREREGKNN